ncbi:MAG: YqaJ viral recombinase family protein [Puniceicoccales bacterium]|jgi:hypothetical protein|nr:YqaJ viral recombinase family protein [Puniceicoccales bacterium]
MDRIHVNLVQRSAEWFFIRRGKITGTDFVKISAAGIGRLNLLREKAEERLGIFCKSKQIPRTHHMERGIFMEPIARAAYEELTGKTVAVVGFVEYLRNDEFQEWCGCSPDGLVENDGIIEIKVPTQKVFHKQRRYIPIIHRRQAMYNVWVTNRRWCDLVLYSEEGQMHVERLILDDEWRLYVETHVKNAIRHIQILMAELSNCWEKLQRDM